MAMSLPALIRVHDQLGKSIKSMVERGILTKKALENAGVASNDAEPSN
jgi:hypothetical protein